MFVVGIDPSISGSCLFHLELDSGLEVVDKKYTLFNSVQRNAKASNNIRLINKDDCLQKKILNVITELCDNYIDTNKQCYFVMEALVPFGISTNVEWQGIYAIVEHYLFINQQPYVKIAPTSLKKHATGSGRAQKPDMRIAFEKFNSDIDLNYLPDTKNPNTDPKSNIWDAYCLAEVGMNLLRKGKYLDKHKKDVISKLEWIKYDGK